MISFLERTHRLAALFLATTILSFVPSASAAGKGDPLILPDTKVVRCEALAAPQDGGVCSVTSGSGALSIKGQVLGIDTVYLGGEALIDATGQIVYVGCAAKRPEGLAALAAAATQIVCAEGVISPGLINAHDHLNYNHNAPFPDSGVRYDHRNGWRSNPARRPPAAGSDEVLIWSEMRHALVGTTALAGAGYDVGFLRNVDAPGWAHPYLDDLLWDVFVGENLSIVTETFPLESAGEYQQYEECSEYTYLGKNYEGADVYVPHVAEGINGAAQSEFACLSSEDFGGRDLVDETFAMVHGVALGAADGGTLAADRAALIWSPRSNISLYGNTAPVSMLKNQGVLLALGTDWVPSGSMNLARELVCADELNRMYLDGAFSDRELWLMVTHNPALALHVADKIGALETGMFGDLAIYDGRGKANPYRAVIEADAESTVLVLRRSSMPFPLEGGPKYVGSIALYGDAAVVAGLPPTLHEWIVGAPLCEPMDVCGAAKAVCPLRETWWYEPFDLATLQSANAESYPLFTCDPPADEPTCVPFRPGEYYGVLDSTGPGKDRDGDFIPDAADNCVRVFNPARPMDGWVQADADGDGRGDACDKCPLTAGPECTAIDPYTGEVVYITDPE